MLCRALARAAVRALLARGNMYAQLGLLGRCNKEVPQALTVLQVLS